MVKLRFRRSNRQLPDRSPIRPARGFGTSGIERLYCGVVLQSSQNVASFTCRQNQAATSASNRSPCGTASVGAVSFKCVCLTRVRNTGEECREGSCTQLTVYDQNGANFTLISCP